MSKRQESPGAQRTALPWPYCWSVPFCEADPFCRHISWLGLMLCKTLVLGIIGLRCQWRILGIRGMPAEDNHQPEVTGLHKHKAAPSDTNPFSGLAEGRAVPAAGSSVGLHAWLGCGQSWASENGSE